MNVTVINPLCDVCKHPASWVLKNTDTFLCTECAKRHPDNETQYLDITWDPRTGFTRKLEATNDQQR